MRQIEEKQEPQPIPEIVTPCCQLIPPAPLVPHNFGCHAKISHILAIEFPAEPPIAVTCPAINGTDYSELDQISDQQSEDSSYDERMMNDIIYKSIMNKAHGYDAYPENTLKT